MNRDNLEKLINLTVKEVDELNKVMANDLGITKSELKTFGKIIPVRTEIKIYRNEPCICGSGLKHKKCCLINK